MHSVGFVVINFSPALPTLLSLFVCENWNNYYVSLCCPLLSQVVQGSEGGRLGTLRKGVRVKKPTDILSTVDVRLHSHTMTSDAGIRIQTNRVAMATRTEAITADQTLSKCNFGHV